MNDQTTAVQILDYIETFLHRICTADLRDQYPYAHRTGTPRVVIPGRSWVEYLQLAVTEIRTYGTHSVQVCRRLRSLLNGVLVVAAPDRREAIQVELSLLDDTIAKGFPGAASLAIARASDPQGIGAPVMDWVYTHRRRHEPGRDAN